ncbi:hypothetical protein [Gelria sp. Kuro-4]|uniref:hypothetical protein n=1 Tax=Gelria sp. Kuro-4 TaxID=2796927 RepID=UPI001BEFD889|nr:hypothetical protein [Gelria sp. Kuro-4]BCV23275.1 hypothetical protein kuro4_00480 [Gelria sp. Kuro-4]
MQNRAGNGGCMLAQERNLREKLASSATLLFTLYDRFCELRSKLLSESPSMPLGGMVGSSEPSVEDYVNFIEGSINLLDTLLAELNSKV